MHLASVLLSLDKFSPFSSLFFCCMMHLGSITSLHSVKGCIWGKRKPLFMCCACRKRLPSQKVAPVVQTRSRFFARVMKLVYIKTQQNLLSDKWQPMHATTKLTSQAIIAKFSWTESNSSVAKQSKPITCAYEAQKSPHHELKP